MPQHNAGLGRNPVTTTLNAGVQGLIPATGQVRGFRLYSTTTNGTTLTALANGTIFPIGSTNQITAAALAFLPSPNTVPVVNGSGVTSPTTAPPLVAGPSGSNPAAGTYMIAYTYVTTMGESLLSPITTYVADGAHQIQLNPFAGPTTGFIQITIGVPRLEEWLVTRYAIYCPSVVSVPSCDIYIDSITTTNLLDTTALGNRNSANATVTLRPGQQMIAIFTLADIGVPATLSVYGQKTTVV